MRRWLVSLVVFAMAWAVSGTVWASSIGRGTEPCGRVGLYYEPTRVPPGSMMSFHFTVWNCSQMTETLLVRSRPSGPCLFSHPGEASYTLEPGMALTQISKFFAPDCLGKYRVRVAVFLEGDRLDWDRAGFVVEQQG